MDNSQGELLRQSEGQSRHFDGPDAMGKAKNSAEQPDNRPETIQQRKAQAAANSSPQVQQLMSYQRMANSSSQVQQAMQMRNMVNSRPAPVAQKMGMGEDSEGMELNVLPTQLMAEGGSQPKEAPKGENKNNTGLPDNLKSGMENLSGFSMDDVQVHYNSAKPAQLQAHAYAQGTDIHLGPGQEQHLGHELAHVVQQKQGRVKPTVQMKGKVPVNDDAGLEREADVMGAQAMALGQDSAGGNNGQKLDGKSVSGTKGVVQGYWFRAKDGKIDWKGTSDNPSPEEEINLKKTGKKEWKYRSSVLGSVVSFAGKNTELDVWEAKSKKKKKKKNKAPKVQMPKNGEEQTDLSPLSPHLELDDEPKELGSLGDEDSIHEITEFNFVVAEENEGEERDLDEGMAGDQVFTNDPPASSPPRDPDSILEVGSQLDPSEDVTPDQGSSVASLDKSRGKKKKKRKKNKHNNQGFTEVGAAEKKKKEAQTAKRKAKREAEREKAEAEVARFAEARVHREYETEDDKKANIAYKEKTRKEGRQRSRSIHVPARERSGSVDIYHTHDNLHSPENAITFENRDPVGRIHANDIPVNYPDPDALLENEGAGMKGAKEKK